MKEFSKKVVEESTNELSEQTISDEIPRKKSWKMHTVIRAVILVIKKKRPQL